MPLPACVTTKLFPCSRSGGLATKIVGASISRVAERLRSDSNSGVPIMNRTVVTPFATITRSSSGAIESGNSSLSDNRCVCMSTSPGTRYFPLPSIRTASLGSFTLFALPISVIDPFFTMTVWFASTRSRSIGITLTLVNATVCADTGVASAAKQKINANKNRFIKFSPARVRSCLNTDLALAAKL